MSRAHLHGDMPRPDRVLGVLDAHAKQALTHAARDIVAPLVAQEAPGNLGAQLKPSVRKTKTGYRATVQAPRRKTYKQGTATIAQVTRWVNRGTGIYRQGAGPKRPITGKMGVLRPMVLPGGRRARSVKGQRPNPFIARAEIRAATPVHRALAQGARHAASALRRL